MIPPIVSADWLAEHFDDVVVADVRWYPDGRDPRAAYEARHLWGAVYVELDTDLSAPVTDPRQGRHPLPSPEEFAAAMSRLGIGDATTVVAYDDNNGSVAARLVWLLRILGRDAAVLDGGLPAWRGAVATGRSPQLPAAAFSVQPWPAERFASIDDVAAIASGTSTATLLDARPAERFTGALETPLDPRPGHIPGARSFPWAGNLDATGRMRPDAELKERFEALEPGDDVVLYCGSGVTACHDLLALEAVGVDGVRLFAPSYSAWASDPDRPVVTGD